MAAVKTAARVHMSIPAELATPFLIAEIIACQSDCSPHLNSPAGGGLSNHDEMTAARERDRDRISRPHLLAGE